MTKNIPSELLSILEGDEFQTIEFKIQKDATTNNRWQLAFFHVQVNLEGLEDVLDLIPGVNFGLPILDVFIHAPGDPINKAYEVTLGSMFSIQGGFVDLAASFNKPPPGFLSNNGTITLSLQPQDGHPGLPLGRIVSEYVGAGLDALDVNVTSLVPQEVKDIVDSITLDQAMLGFVNIGAPTASNWTSKFVEVAVSSAHAPWSPFESFQISNVQLHFVHDSGVDADPTNVTPAATQVEFNADLTVGTNVIQAGFTYQSSTSSWTITLKAGQTIHLVDFILSGIQSVGLEIPSEIVDKIEEILVIDTNSFYISYSPGDATNPKQIAFSNDGLVSLFGIGVTNISVFCSKEGGGPWSYTVSLALPSPCEPLSAFGNIPGLGGIRVVDGKFAFFKDQPSTDVIGKGVLPPGMNSSSITLSGKIKFGNDPGSFMALIKSIVKLDEIDIAILPGVVSIAIPAASLGLNLMDVFKVLSFNFDIFIGGFG